MKPTAVPVAVLLLSLLASLLALGNPSYTIVPAGAAGPGIYLDKVVPLPEASESLPVVERLARIARQPLWATYEIGEPITGGLRMYDERNRLVRTSSITVELYLLTFTNPTTYYKSVYRATRIRCDATGTYRFSIPTDGLEAAFYQVRLGLPNSNDLDPEFRIQIGDAVFTIEEKPIDAQGCGCG